MSLIPDVVSFLNRMPAGVLSVVYELVKAIFNAPEDERLEVAERALKAAASKQATIAAVDAVLKRKP